MEPDVAPFHSSSSPPPLSEEEAGSVEQDQEFGDFGGFSAVVSCSHPVYADPTDSPSSLRQPRPTSKPAARRPNGGFNLPVEQSQPRCALQRQDCGSACRVPLANGLFAGAPGSGTHPASAAGACARREETGFADFTVFAERAARPWCCGFSPAGGGERTRRPTSSAARPIADPVCTKVEHCENRGAAPPLEHGGRETSISALGQTIGVCKSASEDDLSFECPSADLEPNVSSLVSQEEQTDWDQTDDDGDELEDCGRCDFADSEAVRGFHHCDTSATQETRATSSKSPSSDCGSEHRGDPACLRVSLPLSDSFADFCSAPTREDGEGSWAELQDQRALEKNPGTRSREPVSILQEREGVSGRNSCQASLSCRIQQLLLDSFPEAEVPAVEGEEEVLDLCALLHTPLLPEEEEEEKKIPEFCPTSQWTRRRVWRPHQDLHDAVGLRFQWGGSHTHRTLLGCLGVQTRNIMSPPSLVQEEPPSSQLACSS